MTRLIYPLFSKTLIYRWSLWHGMSPDWTETHKKILYIEPFKAETVPSLSRGTGWAAGTKLITTHGPGPFLSQHTRCPPAFAGSGRQKDMTMRDCWDRAGITTASWISDDERASDALSVAFQSTSIDSSVTWSISLGSSSEICQGAKGWLHLETHHHLSIGLHSPSRQVPLFFYK